MDRIAKARLEGFEAYRMLKKWFSEPENENFESGYRVKCYKDAFDRGFMIALRTDVDRFKFLKRCTE